MVEIRIKYCEKKVSNIDDDNYRWWELTHPDEDLVYVEHLMPLHGAIYFTHIDYAKLKKLAEAHNWKIIVI
jgi:hypothetical protein